MYAEVRLHVSRPETLQRVRHLSRRQVHPRFTRRAKGKIAAAGEVLQPKGNLRVLVDGITAGLTDAVPARITVLTAGRVRPIKL
jgi:hypothetical protein